jgi:hypothetical protein
MAELDAAISLLCIAPTIQFRVVLRHPNRPRVGALYRDVGVCRFLLNLSRRCSYSPVLKLCTISNRTAEKSILMVLSPAVVASSTWAYPSLLMNSATRTADVTTAAPECLAARSEPRSTTNYGLRDGRCNQ